MFLSAKRDVGETSQGRLSLIGRELAVKLTVALGLLAALKVGSHLAEAYQVTTPGLYLVAYGAPILLASLIFWGIGLGLSSLSRAKRNQPQLTTAPSTWSR